jgi:hypothetical protein
MLIKQIPEWLNYNMLHYVEILLQRYIKIKVTGMYVMFIADYAYIYILNYI